MPAPYARTPGEMSSRDCGTARRAVLLDVALLLAAAIAVVALPLGFAIWGAP